MAVYTKTGDKGTTGTFGGKRVSKSSKLIETIGSIDELNSYLGILGYKDTKILEIQKNLFTINAILTGAKLKFTENATKDLEKEIDQIEGKLPVQKNFIIYSGTKRATQLFYARALCRKAERELVAISHESSVISAYINRLSDYLFMKAREENFKHKAKESLWKTSK